MAGETQKKPTGFNYINIMSSVAVILLAAMTIRAFTLSTQYEVMKSDNAFRDKESAEFKIDIKESIKELGNKVDGLGERFGKFEYIINENKKTGP